MNRVDWIRGVLTAIGVALIGSASLASMASAAFPGSNGRIAYSDGLNLFDIQPDGTDRRQLTTDGNPNSGGQQNFHVNNTPSYSPDGNQLVFSRSAGRDPSFEGVFTTGADGSGTRPVFRGRTSNANPSFSPDAKRIVFSDFGHIATIGVDGDGKRVLRDDKNKQDMWPSFSPNGRKITFWRVHGENRIEEDIFVMDADGSDLKKLTGRGDNRTPDYAPDGRHIFFASDRGSSNQFRIWRMQADGDHEIPITDTPPDQAAAEVQPAVSPDGKRMAYTRVDRSDVTRVFVTGPLFPLPPTSTLLDPAGGTTGRTKAATWQPR